MALSGNTIGLDVGQSHITATRIAQDDDGIITTLQLGEVGLPRSTFDAQGMLKRPEVVTDAVKMLRKDFGLKGKRALVALGGSALSIQPIERPNNLWGDPLSNSIKLEIEPGLPYDRELAHITFRELSRDPKEGGIVRLLSVAVRSDLPVALATAIRKGGLQADDILPGPTVLPLAIQSGEGSEILLAIGMLSSSVLLLHDGELSYAQTIPVGSDHFTGALVASGLSPAEAERWKRTHSLIAPSGEADPSPDQRAALAAAAENLVEAVYQVLTYDQSEGQAAGIRRLLLSGGGAQLSGLPSYLNRSLGIPVEVAEPREGLEVPEPDRFSRHALSYALALSEGVKNES